MDGQTLRGNDRGRKIKIQRICIERIKIRRKKIKNQKES